MFSVSFGVPELKPTAPAGINTSVQYNNNGAFGGSTGGNDSFLFDPTTSVLTLNGDPTYGSKLVLNGQAGGSILLSGNAADVAGAITSGSNGGLSVSTPNGILRFTDVNGVIQTDGAGSWQLKTIGAGMFVAETNGSRGGKQGTGTLGVGGTVTISNNVVTSHSRIFLTTQSPSGTPGALYVSATVAGTSFSVTSTSAADLSTFAYEIFEPA